VAPAVNKATFRRLWQTCQKDKAGPTVIGPRNETLEP